MVANAIPRRVVVVDRHEAFRDQLVRRLLQDGHDACAVADSLSARRLARWLAFDTAIIADPADVAANMLPGVLRYMVACVILLSDERFAWQRDCDIVHPRAVDLDALCLTLSSGRAAAPVATAGHDSAGPDLCEEEIQAGMHCGRRRGHEGLHRWRSSDAGRSFVWG